MSGDYTQGWTLRWMADLCSVSLGYEILVRPGEGNDGGKDLIVADVFEGKHGRRQVKYLVSCKHKLSSAVGASDEEEIEGRVRSHHCDAFMGVYANHVTQGLIDKAEGLKSAKRDSGNFDIVFIQDADIRRHLLELPDGSRLVRQWFPRGYAAYIHTISESFVYNKRPVMQCTTCKADLLQDFSGVVIYEASHEPARFPTIDPERDRRHRYHILDIKPYCAEHIPPPSRKPYNDASMKFDLRDLVDPKKYIKRVFEDIKFMYAWPPYFASMDVFRKWNHLTHILYYFVARGQHRPKPLPSESSAFHLFNVDEWKL